MLLRRASRGLLVASSLILAACSDGGGGKGRPEPAVADSGEIDGTTPPTDGGTEGGEADATMPGPDASKEASTEAAADSGETDGTTPPTDGGTEGGEADATMPGPDASKEASTEAGGDAANEASTDGAPGDASTSGDAGGSCPAGSDLVYLWGANNNIYSFDPPTKTFKMVATPDCDASNPNSIAIDRNLVAWLNYVTPGASAPNDYIYKFDLTKGSGCQASGIQIPAGFDQVGMGFSTDTAVGTTETLYVDGIGSAGLARVNMTSLTIVAIGAFSNDSNLAGQSCELTGTGSALLYGYFTTSPYVRVAQIDKTNGNTISDTQLQGFTPPSDWAFSFWGGDFYLFAYPNASNSPYSSVVQYDPSTNALNLAYVADVGFTVIGAGVSTCAPTTP
jgi:hypothetical protein